MQRLSELVGAERAPAAISHALHDSIREVGAPVTGAVLVTCADEAEAECARTFDEAFARHILPPHKFGRGAPFRLATVGGHYQVGAVHAAASHFGLAGRGDERRLMVVKVNAHTGCTLRDGAPCYGVLRRYGQDSRCCGALDVLLGGGRLVAQDLADALGSEGMDRLAILRDPELVDPRERGLRAALASARLQARMVVLDIQDRAAATTTSWLVAACVSLNRSERDSEILCGFYWTRPGAPPGQLDYEGLGDDPAAYVIAEKGRHLLVSDADVQAPRVARDHRQLIRARADEVAAATALQRDERLDETRRAVRAKHHRHAEHNGALLSSLLLVLGELAPVPAALLLFTRGIAGVHHSWRVHRIARDLSQSEDARAVLRDVRRRVDQLEPEQREAAIELLMEHH